MSRKIFRIGNEVYPVKIDGQYCNATKKEMSYLYGIVVDVSDYDDGSREYSVMWLDERTNEPAEFEHGLKNSWFQENELTFSLTEYENALDNLSFDEEDGDDLDDAVTELCDRIDNELGHICEEYNLDPMEYADIIIQKVFERMK